MKNIIKICLIVSGLMLFISPVFAAQNYYVQSMKAKLMSEPSFKASVVAEVGKGQQLEFLGRAGNWVRIKYKKKTAYVFSFLVATYKPLERVSFIKGDEADIKHGVRRRASTYTSAAAARGLTSDDRRRLSTQEKASYEGLDEIESIHITDEELSKFIQETR